MKTTYGKSPWIDVYPASRVPEYPRHRGHLDADVAIVGGGLTGCATAYAFAAAGIKVALLDAAQIGRGGSGTSTGWIADDPGVSFVALEQAYGVREARRAFQLWRRGALDMAALVRRLDLKCHLTAAATAHVALTRETAIAVTREQKARRAAGLDATLQNARATAADVAVAAPGGLRTRDGATLDPYRATLGLAAAAVERGARVFEQSPVTRVAFRPKWVDVTTKDGTLRVERVVIATHAPTSLYKALQRHCWLESTFLVLTDAVPARIRQKLGRREAVMRDLASPPHLVRWVGEDRLIVGGGDAPLVPDRLRAKTLVQRTGQLMYELSLIYPDISGLPPAYGWDTTIARTVDGLPYIGPHRNFPRHLFAFGDSSRSITGAYLASRILLRHHLGEAGEADEVFGFARAL